MKKVSMNGKKIDYKNHTIISEVSQKPKKQFELFYRERDKSAPQDQFQSIIFVKSKRCKPDSNIRSSKSKNKKSKVNEQFKKIMKDLDSHMKESTNKPSKQIQQVLDSKQLSSAKPSLKTTGLSKKKSQQNDQNAKPKKLTQRSIGKSSKKVNNFFDSSSLNFTTKKIVSPKKINTDLKLPKGKIKQIDSKIYQTKLKNTQKVNHLSSKHLPKSPIKTRIQNKQIYSNPLNNIPKQKDQNIFENSNLKESNKQAIFKNVNLKHRLNLNQDQYIFLDGDIVQTNDQSLFQLQNRLLSTYRVYDTKRNNQFPNSCLQEHCKNKFQQKQDQNVITDRADQQVQSEQISNLYSKSNSQRELKIVKLFLLKKVIFIQRWWRQVLQERSLKNQNIITCLNKKLKLGKAKHTKLLTNQSQVLQVKKNQTISNESLQYPHFPSQQSIVFGSPQKQERISKKEITFQKREQFQLTQRSKIANSSQMTLIFQRQKMAKDQKLAHQQIIQNLLCQNKIGLDCYNEKLKEIEQEYHKQLDQIEKMRQFLIKNAQKVLNLKKKLIQDKKLAQNINSQKDKQLFAKIFGKKQQSILLNCKSQENIQKQENSTNPKQEQIQLKNYHIGSFSSISPIISKNYIDSNKSCFNKQNQKQNQNNFTQLKHVQKNICSKYKMKKNQKGEEYYEDFQQESESFLENQQMKIDQNQFSIQQIPEGFHPHLVVNTNFTELLQQFKQQQIVKNQIDSRIASQMGALSHISPSSSQKVIIQIQDQKIIKIDTSIVGIHKFLNSFFSFYAYYYKNDFLRLINMPYGYQPQKRMSFIQGHQDTSEQIQEDQNGILYGLQFVMPDQALQDYFDQFYSKSLLQCDKFSPQRQMIQYQKIHNRAVFDAFNQALNYFRPYYGINGPPYPWTSSQKSLTFFFIDAQNIQEVFQKTQFKVLSSASSLLGICIEKYRNQEKLQSDSLQDILNCYKKSSHPIILQNRQQRLSKQQKTQVYETNSKWHMFEQQKCGLFIQIGLLIFEQLAKQASFQLKLIKKEERWQNQFQNSLFFIDKQKQNFKLI